MQTIFFSVGEPSGDLHAANLIESLRKIRADVRCVGYGGPRMQVAGCELHEDLTRLAVMWVAKVIANLPTFLRLLFQANRFFRDHPPAAVVLVDYPGFNWWIARRAKAHGLPVFYYGAPQLWAWAGWRVKKMRRLTDHVLCKLPFEEAWLRDRGCNAHYVGHPYFDELATRALDGEFIRQHSLSNRALLTLLPGSRDQEVAKNLPALLKTAEIVSNRLTHVRVAVASFNEDQAQAASRLVAQSDLTDVDVLVGRTPELIHLADCCMACSGSVSLELMYHHKPAVVHYAVNRLGYVLQDRFRTARYITLVNLLAAASITRKPREQIDGSNAQPFPEFLTCHDASAAIADAVTERLIDAELRGSIVQELQRLCRAYGQPGASQRAAEYVLGQLGSTDSLARAPYHANGNRRQRRSDSVTANADE